MFPKPPAGATANLPIYEAKLLELYILMAVKETKCCRKLFIDSFRDVDVDVTTVVIIMWCVKSLPSLGLVLVFNLSSLVLTWSFSGPGLVLVLVLCGLALVWSWSWQSGLHHQVLVQLFLLFWSR